MLNTNIMPARNLQKSYKSIIEDVKLKKHAVVLTTNNEPQVALVALEDLEKIQQAKNIQTSIDMLKLAVESREELKGLPSNLREQANKILYSEGK